MTKALGFIGGALGDASITFCVLGVALAYTRVLPGLPGFGLFSLGLMLGVVSTVVGFIILNRSGMGLGAAMALMGSVPAAFLIYSLVDGRGVPAINDISTDLDRPPAFVAALEEPANADRDMTFPASFKSSIREAYPKIQPLGMQQNVDAVFAKAMDLAKEQEGWEITATRITTDESVFEGHVTSRVFGFVDDFIVRISRVDGGTIVDMRSKSRDGKSDLGANAARIETFFSGLLGP